jgi:hypothetical protein
LSSSPVGMRSESPEPHCKMNKRFRGANGMHYFLATTF